MTIDDFRASLTGDAPVPDAGLPLQALWWVGKGDWGRAHECAQQREGDPDCDLVHAHLHRAEGDVGNAAYWYRRAGRPVATDPLDEEWSRLVTALLLHA